ncbi:DUF2471 family protein [Paraburkholderia bengalensis]|uniref:DUF2471 family protein n=1 Tax=Paraburkholderia bengalensis TaxID=2747562 RepID=A0ABU8IL72_9BURK
MRRPWVSGRPFAGNPCQFYRLRDSRLLPADLDAPVDWDRDDSSSTRKFK